MKLEHERHKIEIPEPPAPPEGYRLDGFIITSNTKHKWWNHVSGEWRDVHSSMCDPHWVAVKDEPKIIKCEIQWGNSYASYNKNEMSYSVEMAIGRGAIGFLFDNGEVKPFPVQYMDSDIEEGNLFDCSDLEDLESGKDTVVRATHVLFGGE